MRLIDADELIVMEYGGIKFVPVEFINDAPTIEARKTGTDIYMEGNGHCEFKCSVCGVEIGVVEGGELDGGRFHFCPNCGARMEDEP